MEINNNKTMNQIKQEFSLLFPNLKLEFYNSKHDKKKGSPIKDRIKDNLHLGSVRKSKNEGIFMITPKMKVSSLEQSFETYYGIHIQVYRRSGKQWLQTIETDDWSLALQNNEGDT